jgi:S-adenosylmethionine synthetase
MSRSFLFTSESVTEGHPDKVCDQISDAIVDRSLEYNPKARVAVETAIKNNVTLLGEVSGVRITSEEYRELVRSVLNDIGYRDAASGFDGPKTRAKLEIGGQSADIAVGVDETEGRAQGAGDQGIMFGYATNETVNRMPLPISLAHALARKLAELRKNGTLPYLRPDGKSQVTIEYGPNHQPKGIAAVVLSAQHNLEVSQEQLRRDVHDKVIAVVCEQLFPGGLHNGTKFHINPTDRFEIGGPAGDSGVTGRKIIVDTYGGAGRHGGGAFSGKDPSKVDRSAAYAGRWVAKTVIEAGLADRCEVQLSYAIGVAQPISVFVETFGTAKVPEQQIEKAILQTFDLSPKGISTDLSLTKPTWKYQDLAAYGHMGREDLLVPWERTDRAGDLLNAAK